MALGAQPPGSPLYFRRYISSVSHAAPGYADMSGARDKSWTAGTGNVFVNLSVLGTFQYLVAEYDGPNGGAAVWNISSLTGTIEIYGYAKPEKVNGQLTGNLLEVITPSKATSASTSWTLLQPRWSGSGWRCHCDVARSGPRCARYGRVISTVNRQLSSNASRSRS